MHWQVAERQARMSERAAAKAGPAASPGLVQQVVQHGLVKWLSGWASPRSAAASAADSGDSEVRVNALPIKSTEKAAGTGVLAIVASGCVTLLDRSNSRVQIV